MAGVMEKFHHLHYGLAAILGFVGLKMLVSEIYKIPVAISLGFIASALVLSVVASLVWPKQSHAESAL